MVCILFQLKVLQQVDGSSYAPLKDLTIGGIIMVRHVKPGAAEELVEPVAGMCNKNNLF
jgi:26S proteasome regulatory subunit N2